jgi:hypothetical protein
VILAIRPTEFSEVGRSDLILGDKEHVRLDVISVHPLNILYAALFCESKKTRVSCTEVGGFCNYKV